MIDKRLMYAQGKRVGFEPGGMAGEHGMGAGVGADGQTDGQRSGNNDGNTNREKGIMSRGLGPKGTTGNTNDFTSDKDGVDRSAVGPRSKYASNKFREGMLKSIKEVQTNPKYGGGGFFDSGLGKFIKGFGKTALMAYAPAVFGPKFAPVVKAYKGAKVAKDFLDKTDIFNTFDVKNPIADLFSGNNKSKSTSTINNFNEGDDQDYKSEGEGLASLENINALENEYILLLQKNLKGTFNDEEQVRFTMLKKMLGK